MRFLMLNWRDPHNPLAGGAERVTLGYLGALARRGHEVYWYANAYPGAPATSEVDGVRIVRGGGIGTSVLQAIRWARRQKPFDLVIDQHHGIPWFAPWWARTQTIAYIHEVLGPIWKAFYPWPLSAAGQWQERVTHWFYRRVPFWTACQSTRQSLLRHGVRTVTIIPYGIDTVALPQLDEKTLQLPLKLAVVSRLAPNKRIDHAIQVVNRLEERNIEAHLTIVGAGESEAQLRKLTARLGLAGSIHFTGPLPEAEKNQALRAAHFLLHTSIREGWGLNVIEANAMGTPAAVYPVPGLVDSTLHEITGLVSEAETPQSLGESLQMILGRPEKYQDYRRQAWERAKEFHWDKVLPKAADWLESQARHSG